MSAWKLGNNWDGGDDDDDDDNNDDDDNDNNNNNNNNNNNVKDTTECALNDPLTYARKVGVGV